MPTDIAIHAMGNHTQGHPPPAPIVPPLAGQRGLAENVDSDTFAVSQAVVLAVTPSLKIRLDVQRVGGGAPALDPANSFIVVQADQTAFFTIEKGAWKIKTLAYT